MRKALWVAARELRERWLFFPAGLALGCIPLALPAFGVSPQDSPGFGLAIALMLGGAAALVAGGTMLARDAASSRIGFLFSQPLPWPAIWAGKWLAAVVLAGVTGLLASVPWMIAYPTPQGGLWLGKLLDLQGTVAAISWVVALVGLANLGSTSFRSRSAFVAVDLACLAMAVWGIRRYVPTLLCGLFFNLAPWPFVAVAATPGLALLAASAVQVAVGRTDIRRAHRALSLTFWGLVFTMLLGAAGNFQWVLAARPADFRDAYATGADPSGRWIQLSGESGRFRCLRTSFLVEAGSGRFVRLLKASDLVEPTRPSSPWLEFAQRAERAAGWATGSDDSSTVLELFDLSSSTPRLSRVRLEGLAEPQWRTLFRLSPGGNTALLVGASASASLFDTGSGRRLATADVPRGSFAGEAVFTSETSARVWLNESGGPSRVLDLAKGLAPGWSDFSVPPSIPGGDWHDRRVVPLPDGNRVLFVDRGVTLRDGKTGALLATLIEGARWYRARPLADGRIVVVSTSGDRTWLSLFDRDGGPLREVDLGPGRAAWATHFPEVAPGQIAVGLMSRPSQTRQTVIVDANAGRVVDRLDGLLPAEALSGRAAVQISGAALLNRSGGEVVSLDLATGKRTVVAGPGAPKGEAIEPVVVSDGG